jgi:hypothetical protein
VVANQFLLMYETGRNSKATICTTTFERDMDSSLDPINSSNVFNFMCSVLNSTKWKRRNKQIMIRSRLRDAQKLKRETMWFRYHYIKSRVKLTLAIGSNLKFEKDQIYFKLSQDTDIEIKIIFIDIS